MGCSYCNKPLNLVTGKTIYPHLPNLAEKKFWICHDCNAYVGCHRTSHYPLGTVAKSGLRKMRMNCHQLFDPLWKELKLGSRSRCYKFLIHTLKNLELWGCPPSLLKKDEIHFSQLNEEEAEYVYKVLKRESTKDELIGFLKEELKEARDE